MYVAGDKDDIVRYADRILARAMTVEVAVRTDRDPQQEEALHQVNIRIYAVHSRFLLSIVNYIKMDEKTAAHVILDCCDVTQ